jgi:hypothetical protein
MQHSRQPSLRKITRKNQEHVCNIHTIKSQKRIYPKVAESAILGLLSKNTPYQYVGLQVVPTKSICPFSLRMQGKFALVLNKNT